MISQLDRQKLISIKEENGEPSYIIHRVLQKKIQFDLDEYSFADAFRKAFRLIRKKFPRAGSTQVPDARNMELCKRYMPHVESFHAAFMEHSRYNGTLSINAVDPKELVEMFYDAGFFVWAGQSTAYDGVVFMETCEKILVDMKVDISENFRADINCIYGLLLVNMGYVQRTAAAERLEQTWEIRKNLYFQNPIVNGEEDVLSQNAANDWCICLINLYRFQEARSLLQNCLSRYQSWGDERDVPFEYSKFYGNYSVILLWEGKFDEAIDYGKRCLALTEEFAGRMSQYYRRLFFLGCIYLQAGRLQESLDSHLEVVQARLTLQGKSHEDTIMSLYAVGAVFHYLGDYGNAM